MSQAEALASHWVLLFFLGLLNKYMIECSVDHTSVGRPTTLRTRDFIQRSWSEWTAWSDCSRTCGGGVKMRTRLCKISTVYSVVPHSNSCIGETTEHELCSIHNCSPYDKEFLEFQCSNRDGQTVRGRKIEEWIPYRYGKNPCELQCWAKDRSIMHSFGKAIDGTKCATSDPKQPALCINGRCTPVDCAGQIGSDNKLDRCGVCRGNNSTCVHFKDVFWGQPRIRTPSDESKDHHYEYEKITTIPAGVTEIIVRESCETNFLAVMDHKGNYVINGNWRIQSPGRIFVHGSEFLYNRTWDGRESLSAQGPIRFEIHVYVLGTGDIPTVNFEYWTSSTTPLKALQPFPILNQIKPAEEDTRYLQPENNHIHDVPPTKKHSATQFQGYKSFYHRNEILKSVPSWSIKRHRTHKNNRYLYAQNDISSSTLMNRVEINTVITPHNKVQPSLIVPQNKVQPNLIVPQNKVQPNLITPQNKVQPNLITPQNKVQPSSVAPYYRMPSSGITPYTKVPSSSETSDKSEIRRYDAGITNRHKNVFVNSKINRYQTSIRQYPSSNHQGLSFHQVENSRRNTTKKPTNNYNSFNLNQRYEISPNELERKRVFEGRPVEDYEKPTTALALTQKSHHPGTVVTLQPNALEKEANKVVGRKNGRRRQTSMKYARNSNNICQPCPKSKQQKKNVCASEFVLRATVLSIEKQDASYRYELQINQSLKNKVPISPREYVWTTEPCRCPKLRVGNEYIITGYSGISGNRRESRLLVGRNSFVRKYSHKRARNIQRIVRDQNTLCRKFE